MRKYAIQIYSVLRGRHMAALKNIRNKRICLIHYLKDMAVTAFEIREIK